MTDRQPTLSDMVGQMIEILGRTFTVDWIDAPKSKDNGKIMIQSDETDVYYIGDENGSIFVAFMEIYSELRKEAKEKMNAGVHGKKVVE